MENTEKTKVSDPTVKAGTVKTTVTNCPNCGAAITEENSGEFCIYCKTKFPEVVADQNITNNIDNRVVNEYHTTNIYQTVSGSKTNASGSLKKSTSIKSASINPTRLIVGLGLMTAIVVVLQLLSTVIKFGPFSITLALTAIIVGGAIYGVWGGAWLGFVFGMTVLLSGDATAFMTVSPIGTILTVLLKGAGAGALAALVYNLIEKKNRFVAVIAAGVVAPVVNTGIFILGVFVFFLDTITAWAAQTPVVEYIFVGLIGLNFPVELMVNLALSTVTVTIIGIIKKSMAEK